MSTFTQGGLSRRITNWARTEALQALRSLMRAHYRLSCSVLSPSCVAEDSRSGVGFQVACLGFGCPRLSPSLLQHLNCRVASRSIWLLYLTLYVGASFLLFPDTFQIMDVCFFSMDNWLEWPIWGSESSSSAIVVKVVKREQMPRSLWCFPAHPINVR